MDYAQEQRNPAKHLTGIGFVIVLHLAIGYALVNGLANKALLIIQEPLDITIVEETKPPEPEPPPPDLPPPPQMDIPPPPPSQMPPPEVKVDVPPPANAVSAVAQTAPTTTFDKPTPPQPKVDTPVAPPAPPAPPPPLTVTGLCSNHAQVRESMTDKFVVLADKEGINGGEVLVEVTLGPGGEVKSTQAVKTSDRRLNRLAETGARQLSCRGQGQEVKVQYAIVFKLE